MQLMGRVKINMYQAMKCKGDENQIVAK